MKQKKLLKEYRSIFEKNSVIKELEKINQKILEPKFWDDKKNAQTLFKKKKFLEDLVNHHQKAIVDIKDLSELFDLANEENNNAMINDIIKNLKNLKAKDIHFLNLEIKSKFHKKRPKKTTIF